MEGICFLIELNEWCDDIQELIIQNSIVHFKTFYELYLLYEQVQLFGLFMFF